jgi:hypothetical protein
VFPQGSAGRSDPTTPPPKAANTRAPALAPATTADTKSFAVERPATAGIATGAESF